jgi:hypothetical protein
VIADRSPVEEAALGYCGPRGIPLSVFLGRVVYPGEPQWTEDDARAALDWQAEDARRCPNGHDTAESMKKENAFAYRATPLRCHACFAAESAEAQMLGHKPNQHAGTLWRLSKIEETHDGRIDEPDATGSETQQVR